MNCGNCKETHESVAQVRACYGHTSPSEQLRLAAEASTSKALTDQSPEMAGTIPTAKQLDFIAKLRDERGFNPLAENDWPKTRDEASRMIDHLFTLPKVQKPAEALDLDARHLRRGAVHVIDGTYYRVHVSQSSGRPYAVKATVVQEAVWSGSVIVEAGIVEWDMARGMIGKLTKDTLATREQSKAFGHLVGRCCFCSTKIDTPESTTAGYGPVCAEKYGLPWGATLQLLTAAAIDDGFAPLAVR